MQPRRFQEERDGCSLPSAQSADSPHRRMRARLQWVGSGPQLVAEQRAERTSPSRGAASVRFRPVADARKVASRVSHRTSSRGCGAQDRLRPEQSRRASPRRLHGTQQLTSRTHRTRLIRAERNPCSRADQVVSVWPGARSLIAPRCIAWASLGGGRRSTPC